MYIVFIRMFSYEGLKATLYQLQNRLVELTGQDPLKDKGASIFGSQISPSKLSRDKDGLSALH